MGVATLALVAVALPFVQNGVSNVSAGTCNYPGAYSYDPGPPMPNPAKKLNLQTELNKTKPKPPVYSNNPTERANQVASYKEELASWERTTAKSVASKVSIHNQAYDKWKPQDNKQRSAYSVKLSAYGACAAKLKAALAKAQAVVNSKQVGANKTQHALQAANAVLDSKKADAEKKNEKYKSFTNPTAENEQKAALRTYTDATAVRLAAKTAVDAAQDNVSKKKEKFNQAQTAYNASKTTANKTALDDAKAMLENAKDNLKEKEAKLSETYRPFKDAEADLTQKNNRLAKVQAMDAIATTDPNYASVLKPRTDAKKDLDKAREKRDAAKKVKDSKQAAYKKASAALAKARSARDAAQRAYDAR